MLEAIDRRQQRVPPFAFAVGVVRKYGADRGSFLAALLTFYGFLSLFPLLLLLVTVVNYLAPSDGSFLARVEHSAFAQFPLVGTRINENIRGIQDGSPFALIVGVLGLVWGSLGVLQVAQHAQAEVWNLPQEARPGFWPRLGRGVGVIGLLGVFLVTSTAVAGIVTLGHRGLPIGVVGPVVSVALNAAFFAVGFRLLTPRAIRWAEMLPGAVVGAGGWTALQYFGGILVAHSLRNTSKEYGMFALVLGFLGFLYLSAQVGLYASEVNVVRARHLWPRSLVESPGKARTRNRSTGVAPTEERRAAQAVSSSAADRSSPHSVTAR